jgi:hypothetical protein
MHERRIKPSSPIAVSNNIMEMVSCFNLSESVHIV